MELLYIVCYWIIHSFRSMWMWRFLSGFLWQHVAQQNTIIVRYKMSPADVDNLSISEVPIGNTKDMQVNSRAIEYPKSQPVQSFIWWLNSFYSSNGLEAQEISPCGGSVQSRGWTTEAKDAQDTEFTGLPSKEKVPSLLKCHNSDGKY